MAVEKNARQKWRVFPFYGRAFSFLPIRLRIRARRLESQRGLISGPGFGCVTGARLPDRRSARKPPRFCESCLDTWRNLLQRLIAPRPGLHQQTSQRHRAPQVIRLRRQHLLIFIDRTRHCRPGQPTFRPGSTATAYNPAIDRKILAPKIDRLLFAVLFARQQQRQIVPRRQAVSRFSARSSR